MKLHAGTSGFAFKEWKGSFYPEKIKADAMLGFYAAKFPTVEINNTFYRLPKEEVIKGWGTQVEEGFTFSIKASQRITHFARLKPEAADPLNFLLANTASLGEKLGPTLFQLPPNLKKDAPRLRAFLALLPEGRKYAMEFRHDSWFDDETYDALRERDIAHVLIDQAEFAAPAVATSTWGYVRLHRFDYGPIALREWAERIQALPWTEAFVYFKHDEGEGSGPPAVGMFLDHWKATAEK